MRAFILLVVVLSIAAAVSHRLVPSTRGSAHPAPVESADLSPPREARQASRSAPIQAVRHPDEAATPSPSTPETAAATITQLAPADPRLSHRVRVAGRVLNESGVPVPGVDLAFFVPHAGLDANAADWDFADRQGRYEVRVVPGAYDVHEDEDGAWWSRVNVPWTDGTFDLDLVAPTGLLHGTVHTSDGRPAAGVRIFALQPERRVGSCRAPRPAGGQVVTDDDGAFSFSSLPAGRWTLFAQGDGASAWLIASTSQAAVDITLQSTPPAHLTVTDGDGHGVAADVWLQPLDAPEQVSLILPTGGSGYDGVVRLPGVPPGRYRVCGGGAVRRHDLVLDETVELQSGTRAHVLADRCATLAVTVQDEAGQPVIGASLMVRPETPDRRFYSLEAWEDWTASDRLGRLHFEDVVPGSYRVAASKAGQRTRFHALTLLPAEAHDLTLTFEAPCTPSTETPALR